LVPPFLLQPEHDRTTDLAGRGGTAHHATTTETPTETPTDRDGLHATLVSIQLPMEHWHDSIGDAMFHESLMDQQVNHVHQRLAPAHHDRITTSDFPASQSDSPLPVRSSHAVIGIDRNE